MSDQERLRQAWRLIEDQSQRNVDGVGLLPPQALKFKACFSNSSGSERPANTNCRMGGKLSPPAMASKIAPTPPPWAAPWPISAVAITIVHALGPTWQDFITDDASQIITFPIDRTAYLRFVKAGGAAPSIWLLPFDMASVAAARQIMSGLIEPYRSSLKDQAATAA